MYPIEFQNTSDASFLKGQLTESQLFLNLMLGLTELVNEPSEAPKFLHDCLSAICHAFQRPIGLAWFPRGSTQELYCQTFVTTNSIGKEELFLASSVSTRYKIGSSIPGTVLQQGIPITTANLPRFKSDERIYLAYKAGLRSAFAFPIAVEGRTIAIFEFFGRQQEELNGQAAPFLIKLGALIGVAYEHKDGAQKRKTSEQIYQEELHNREQLLAAILDRMAEAVFVADINGKLLLANPAGVRLVGSSLERYQEDFKDKPGVFEIDMITPFPIEQMPIVRAFKGEEVDDVELFLKNEHVPQGRFLNISARPLCNPSGDVIAAVTVARDTTQRRQMERQLQATADEAIAASRLKSEFVANVSHEIRTPLAGILGMSELLATQENGDAESIEIAHYILQSAQSLLSIVNDLLDFSKLESGKVTLYSTEIVIRSLLEEVATSVKLQAAKKNLVVSLEVDSNIPDRLFGDHGRIVQVLLNFASNAVKFTDKGSIEIGAQLCSMTSAHATVRLYVRDTGIGISKEVQGTLFAPFVQADGSTTRRYGGTGLGLSISKKLSELMSGEVGLDSSPGAGSTFSVILPLSLREGERFDR